MDVDKKDVPLKSWETKTFQDCRPKYHFGKGRATQPTGQWPARNRPDKGKKGTKIERERRQLTSGGGNVGPCSKIKVG